MPGPNPCRTWQIRSKLSNPRRRTLSARRCCVEQLPGPGRVLTAAERRWVVALVGSLAHRAAGDQHGAIAQRRCLVIGARHGESIGCDDANLAIERIEACDERAVD